MAKVSKKKMGVKKPSDQYDRHMQAFRSNVRILLDSLGWTTRQFAAQIPCSQGYVNIILNGDEPIALQLMCNIADALGVPVLAMLTPGAFKSRKAS